MKIAKPGNELKDENSNGVDFVMEVSWFACKLTWLWYFATTYTAGAKHCATEN